VDGANEALAFTLARRHKRSDPSRDTPGKPSQATE
jgi:hypothetical protein